MYTLQIKFNLFFTLSFFAAQCIAPLVAALSINFTQCAKFYWQGDQQHIECANTNTKTHTHRNTNTVHRTLFHSAQGSSANNRWFLPTSSHMTFVFVCLDIFVFASFCLFVRVLQHRVCRVQKETHGSQQMVSGRATKLLTDWLLLGAKCQHHQHHFHQITNVFTRNHQSLTPFHHRRHDYQPLHTWHHLHSLCWQWQLQQKSPFDHASSTFRWKLKIEIELFFEDQSFHLQYWNTNTKCLNSRSGSIYGNT